MTANETTNQKILVTHSIHTSLIAIECWLGWGEKSGGNDVHEYSWRSKTGTYVRGGEKSTEQHLAMEGFGAAVLGFGARGVSGKVDLVYS